MKKVVVIGGGTGNFMVLSGLKKYPFDLTAVVSMTDNGGSTGVLRDELGVLPPGDIRQCLVALATSEKVLRELFNYRFEEGSLIGHSFGNLFITSLEKITGSFEDAVMEAGKVLAIKGRVLPVTCQETTLCVDLGDKTIVRGQIQVDGVGIYKYPNKKLFLEPEVMVNPKVKKVISEADLIVISPGSLYSSLLPNFLPQGMKSAIKGTGAKIVYVGNLVNKPDETAGYELRDYVSEIENCMGRKIDYVLYNSKKPQGKLLNRYANANELLIRIGKGINGKIIKADLLSEVSSSDERLNKSPFVIRKNTLIRHDPNKVASELKKMLATL